jgi:hypothetical protein
MMLVPAALIAAAPVQAEQYLTVEQAQAALFPNASFTPADFTMSEEQQDELMKAVPVPMLRSKVKAWKVSSGGWFFLDQVFGRDDRITYAIGLDANGAVVGIEVLVCDSGYTGVRAPNWRAQFHGRRHNVGPDLAKEFVNISGTTLSAQHIAEGVKRMLATHAMFIVGKEG